MALEPSVRKRGETPGNVRPRAGPVKYGRRKRRVGVMLERPEPELASWPALWTFAEVPDVEPTNNAAERGLRAAVIYRKLSLGSRSQDGERTIERLLSVDQTRGCNSVRSTPTSPTPSPPKLVATLCPFLAERRTAGALTAPRAHPPKPCRCAYRATLDEIRRPRRKFLGIEERRSRAEGSRCDGCDDLIEPVEREQLPRDGAPAGQPSPAMVSPLHRLDRRHQIAGDAHKRRPRRPHRLPERLVVRDEPRRQVVVRASRGPQQ